MLYAQTVRDYQWKNRLIVLVDTVLETSAMQSQLKLLLTDEDALEERDIVLFQLTPETIILSIGKKPKFSPQETYSSLSIRKDFKGVILIGKDGGMKLRKPFEVPPETIFTLIDGMPMRKSEIKRNQGN